MLPSPDTTNQDTMISTTLFQSVRTPYAVQPLLCLRPPTTPEKREALTLKLSTTGIGWSLEWPADDPCRWLVGPAVDHATFLHHYGTSYVWRLRDRPIWTTEMTLDCLERWPAHSYELIELSHVLHSIPTPIFVRLLTALTRLCRPGGIVRWVEGSWLHSQGECCQRAIAWVQRLASKRGCGAPDTDHATMGLPTILPRLMQHWLSRMSAQPVERLDAALRIASRQQVAERCALARALPFWLHNMTEATLASATPIAQARQRLDEQHLVDEIVQPSFTATCTLHVQWTQPVGDAQTI